MSFLELDGLRKTYPDGTEAVRGVDLAVHEGEFVALLGPSGCGKTTTLRMIAGLEIPTAGRILLGDEDVTRVGARYRDIGFVFQLHGLYPHLTVRGHLHLPLETAGVSAADRRPRVAAMADRLGLGSLLDLFPRQLSGGDRQRAALGRALIRAPRVCLMDEPLGMLDAQDRFLLREEIRRAQQETGMTTVYVTHDQEEAMSLADRIVVMDQGLVRQAGPPEDVYDAPADRFVAEFVGSPGMALLDGGARGVRPEAVSLDAAGDLEGPVVLDEYLGPARLLHVETPAGRVIVRVAPDARHAPGTRVRIAADQARVIRFDPRTGRRQA